MLPASMDACIVPLCSLLANLRFVITTNITRLCLMPIQTSPYGSTSLKCHCNCDVETQLATGSCMHVAVGPVQVCVACLQEECTGWDVSSVVFSPALWPTYHAIMRADFKLFDEYQHTPPGTLYPVPCSIDRANPAVETYKPV